MNASDAMNEQSPNEESGKLRTIISREPRLMNVLLETKPLLIDFPIRKNVLVRARDVATILRDPGYQNFTVASVLVNVLVRSIRPGGF